MPAASPRVFWVLAALALAALAALPPVDGAPTKAILQATTTTDPAAALPGTSGAVTFTLVNQGDATAYRIQAEVTGIEGGLLINGLRADLGAVGPSASTVVSPFSYEVPSTTPPGFYHLTVAITYSFQTGNGTGFGDFATTATVAVRAAPTARVVSIAPRDVEPGADVQANVTLINDGPSNFTNVALQWTSPDGTFLPLGQGNAWRTARLDAGASVAAPLWFTSSPNAAPGTYLLRVTLTYVDTAGTLLNSSTTLGLRLGGPGSGTHNVRVTATNLTGDSVTLALTNTLATAVTAIEVRLLDGPGVRLTGADAAVFARIEPGSYAAASFDVARRAGADPFALVQVLYTDSQGVPHKEVTHVDLQGVALPLDRTALVGYTAAGILGAEAILAGAVLAVRRNRRRRNQERRARAQGEEAFMQGPAPPPAAPPPQDKAGKPPT